MNKTLRIAIAQLNFSVSDIEGNTEKIIIACKKARDQLAATIVVFPEMTLTGYPPEDLLLRRHFYLRVQQGLNKIKKIKSIYIILGYPKRVKNNNYNQAAVIHNGKTLTNYSKQFLPNYSVFDEKRYFTPGDKPGLVTINNIPIALTICEDLWFTKPMLDAKANKAQLMISLNASPFDITKAKAREKILKQRAKEGNIPIIYANLVGGQDELVFDGGSLVVDAKGKVCQQAEHFSEQMLMVDFVSKQSTLAPVAQSLPKTNRLELAYNALVMGVRDYILKNKFAGVLVGLSGGIDSALTLAIATDAIGSENVEAVLMPSRFTRKMSVDDAITECKNLQIKYSNISIEPMFKAFLASLKEEFKGLPADVTEENIQARCRGIILMAISNKKHFIVLSTGNKSEMAVGYSTLYGDMVGGFCVLKDVPKTLVYQLANYRNTISTVIPERVITRPPSAELAKDQTDQDSLPEYDVLDKILEYYIEQDLSEQQIIAKGFAAKTVARVINLVNKNEYKRRQAPPGIKITQRAFGKDRRYPITAIF